mmetsp:Transcript_22257/g.77123  ORF Transcript_22257/g.77123 Transcript_22257/m.77123 type:complete len:204 (-) Transcript_22257:1219-1830(-)
MASRHQGRSVFTAPPREMSASISRRRAPRPRPTMARRARRLWATGGRLCWQTRRQPESSGFATSAATTAATTAAPPPASQPFGRETSANHLSTVRSRTPSSMLSMIAVCSKERLASAGDKFTSKSHGVHCESSTTSTPTSSNARGRGAACVDIKAARDFKMTSNRGKTDVRQTRAGKTPSKSAFWVNKRSSSSSTASLCRARL